MIANTLRAMANVGSRGAASRSAPSRNRVGRGGRARIIGATVSVATSAPRARPSAAQLAARLAQLRNASIEPSTARIYATALQVFLEYCVDNNELCRDAVELDAVLCEYFVFLHESDGSVSTANNTLYAVKHFLPQCKYLLPDATQVLRGWNKSSDHMSRPPLTQELTVVLAISMLKAGHLPAAVATLLAFDCYLRIGEFCSLRVRDVALNHQMRFGSAFSGMVIGLAKTKTGVNQSVPVKDSVVEVLVEYYLREYRHGSHPSSSLFGLTTHQYRRAFHLACHSLGLAQFGFTPHSLRHGGATRDFLRERPLEEIILRGRWASSTSVRRYIQSGRMLLIAVDATALQQTGAALLAQGAGQYLLDLFYAVRHK